MSIITTYSTKNTVDEAIQEISSALANIDPGFIIFFSSTSYNPEEISTKMKETFKKAEIIGCTTAGELVSKKMMNNSIVVMAADADSIQDVAVGVMENINNPENVKQVFESFETRNNKTMRELDINEYVGIILTDGLSGAEESLMDKIGDLTNVIFIGGAAGDDLKFTKTNVFINGKTYVNAAILALLKPTNGYDIIKTQSFCKLDKQLTATKVNEAAREVIEFNNKPAAIAYAEAIGVTLEEAHKHFMHNPVGLMVGDEPYVRSPQQIIDNKMKFYCNIVEGMELSILESTNIIDDTKKVLEDKLQELDNKVAGVIDFHCILRTLELQEKGLKDEYGKIFENVPMIGFSTYGEEYIGHINQTSTILVIK